MPENLEQALKDVSAELVKVTNTVKQTAEKAEAEMKNLGAVTAETKATADQALTKHNEIAARLTEIEQALAARDARGGMAAPRSMGRETIDNDDVKAFMERGARGHKGSVTIEVQNALTSVTTDTDGAAGDLVTPDRRGGVLVPPQRRMTVRDLLTPGSTQSNSIEYVKETGFTNNAAPVTEGAQKPESTMKFDLVSLPVTTIAHFVQASRQILADAPMLRSHIDGRLRYGLAYKEELQLLKGAGTGINLHGIYPQASAFSAAFAVANMTVIDVIRLAMLQAVLAEYPATGIVLHPTDWANIETTKDTTGRYIIGNPQGTIGATLWSLPVVATQAMDVDTFLVGAFKLGAQIFDRETVSVTISTEDRDNFVKNMVTMLCEERLGLAVYRPEAFIKGDISEALSG